MNDEIVAFIREQRGGVASEVIAEKFLRFKNPNKALADTAVGAILSKDLRVRRGDDGLWAPGIAGARRGGDATDVGEVPWVTIYVLTDASRKSVIHISLWAPVAENRCVCSVWLADPAQFSEDDRQHLCDPRDLPYDAAAATAAIDQIAAALAGKIPLFLSQQQYSLFTLAAQRHGINAGIDDYYLMNQLFRAIKEREPKPLTLESAAAAVLGGFRTAESAYSRGEQWGRVAGELIGKMKPAGIETRGHLDAALSEGGEGFGFSGTNITAKTLEELPDGAGVYGFTDKSGAYIYIGKAVNLKRRIGTYFRFNSESPEKLAKLRKDAHDLTIHRCGSELEALIYEYRLIKKHKPALNTQYDISERKGSYKPIPDSVVILPHAQEGFLASVWIKKDQKVKLRACGADFADEEAIKKELQEYFYSGALPASPEDFPELEIVTRWVKRHRDDVSAISVSNMADVGEIINTMKNM
ncbi:MAG: nucleotide excision repair endonuclease [Chitinispirillia bacterium]|nr:nucleotide excision repair endonuclease [Chitinispirillia bacterium]MCL2242634.1 nucleotide excision repair endonuclease [Chitinispirillia bacterium]